MSTGALHQNLDKSYYSKRVRKIWRTISSWLRGSRFLLGASGSIREVGNVLLVPQSESCPSLGLVERELIEFWFP